MQLLGLFYTKNQRELQDVYDAPYHMLGRHALCSECYASDGGAIAYAIGRLRNGIEIHNELRKAGLTVKDPSDLSELVLNAYRLWGTEYPCHLEGVIVTGVIDQDANCLVLSRDRMGELPLFYAYRGSSIAFSDHPAPLLKCSLASSAVNWEGLCEIFGLGPARTPGRTPFRDIHALEPGSYLVADQKGHEIIHYFRLEAYMHEDDLQTTIDTVRSLVERAVKDTLMFSPGSMLSGGLDSTVLTALAHQHSSAPLATYSVDYEDNQMFFTGSSYQPERDAPYIEQAVNLYGTHHTYISLSIESLYDALTRAMELRGFPGMADIDSSLFLFSNQVARRERYVLSGECGDEVFGGYPWFRRDELIYSELFPWSGSMALREGILKKSIRSKINLAKYVTARYYESIASLPVVAKEGAREAKLRQVQGLCFEWFMTNLQERAQRMASASGLTVLTPYCDERLVQYVYNVPWDMKTMNGEEKGLLRAAVADILPEELLHRKKSPYPKTYHPTYTRMIRHATTEMLNDSSSPILQLIDADKIRSLMNGALSPTETPWFGQLMSGPQMLAYLLQVNAWMKKYDVDIYV